MWHQIPFIRALQRLQNPPDELNHCLCLFTWYVTYKCTKYKTFKDKCFTQNKENSLSNQSKCYGFQLRFICKVVSWENNHLIINTMVHTVNRAKVLLACKLIAYNRSVEELRGWNVGDLSSGLIHGRLGKEQPNTVVTTPYSMQLHTGPDPYWPGTCANHQRLGCWDAWSWTQVGL